MTFEYTDDWGRRLAVSPDADHNDQPVVALWSHGEYGASIPVRIPLDRVEEAVAGIRDAARTASGQQAECDPRCSACGHPIEPFYGNDWIHTAGSATGCLRATPAVGQPAEAQAANRAAVLDDAIKAVLGRVEAYEGMGQDAVDRNRERTAIANLIRRMAEEARS